MPAQCDSGSDVLSTDATYDPGQWELNSGILRTTGAAAATPQLLNFVVLAKFGLNVPAGVRITGVAIDLPWSSQSTTGATLARVALYYRAMCR
jgi:hypothetical protein